jgi:PhnB protein
VQPAPPGYTAVTPWIVSRSTDRLLAFVTEAFGAEELARVPNPDGSIGHAEFRIGDAVVMAFDARPSWPATPAFLRLYVTDGDAVFRRALDAGATPVTEMTNLFFGDRVGRVRDALGNVWWIQARVDELPPEELQRRATEERYRPAMEYVQQSLDAAMRVGAGRSKLPANEDRTKGEP